MSFETATRHKIVPLVPQSISATARVLKWTMDKAGYMAGIYLPIIGSLTGTLTAPNALGKACIVKGVRLQVNSQLDLIVLNGVQYHYMLRDYIETFGDPVPQSDAKSAVAAGAYNLSMFLPIALNARDRYGLFPLQNEKTTVTLSVEIDADANIATGITAHTCTISPKLEIFTVPPDPKDQLQPELVQSIIGEPQTITAAGDVEYIWPRGNTIFSMIHAAGIGAAGADAWSKAILRAQQNDVIYEMDPLLADYWFSRFHGRARVAGVIPWDLIGSSGLGRYSSARDSIYTQAITSLKTVFTFTGATTLHSVRAELVPVKAAG